MTRMTIWRFNQNLFEIKEIKINIKVRPYQ